MFEKTLGIVLGSVPYDDHQQFVHIYTQRFGKISYKTAIRRRRKTEGGSQTFVPMTLLEMDVEHNENAEVQKIKETSIVSSPLSLDSSPLKFTQCLFISEVIDKCVREVEQNPLLWEFLINCLNLISLPEYSSEDFHLLFLARLFVPLGFGIDNSLYLKGMQFDMNEGKFTHELIAHPYYLNALSAEYLHRLLSADFSDLDLKLNAQERHIMLDILIAFLKIHIPEMGELKTVEVVKQLI